jgi:hypothetical protein
MPLHAIAEIPSLRRPIKLRSIATGRGMGSDAVFLSTLGCPLGLLVEDELHG